MTTIRDAARSMWDAMQEIGIDGPVIVHIPHEHWDRFEYQANKEFHELARHASVETKAFREVKVNGITFRQGRSS